MILLLKLCLSKLCLFIACQITGQPDHATHNRVISQELQDYVFSFSTLVFLQKCHIQLEIFKVLSQIVCFMKWVEILFTVSTNHEYYSWQTKVA